MEERQRNLLESPAARTDGPTAAASASRRFWRALSRACSRTNWTLVSLLILLGLTGSLLSTVRRDHNILKTLKKAAGQNTDVGLRSSDSPEFPRIGQDQRSPNLVAWTPPATPLVGKPVQLRALPYPFYTYLTINSDPDAMTFSEFLQIHPILHDDYQLNLGDQVFIDNPSYYRSACDVVGVTVAGEKAQVSDLQRFYKFLVAYNRGWVDGVHGWHNVAYASSDHALSVAIADNQSVTRDIDFEFSKETGYLKGFDAEDLNYVLLEYRMPAPRSSCQLKAGNQSLDLRSTIDETNGMGNSLSWTPVYGLLPKGPVPKVTLEFRGPQGALLEVRNCMVCNLCRHRARLESEFLARHGAYFFTYSDHGRLRNELSTGTRFTIRPGITRPQALLDNPGENLNTYLMDILEKTGMMFFNASHHTAQAQALPIEEVIKPHRFNDGVVRHLTQRFMAYPVSGCTPPLLSAEAWLGFMIDSLLVRSVTFGKGGIIYTHWGGHHEDGILMSPATRQQLAELQDRFYNLSGRRAGWERTWIAPATEILLYARALQGIQANASYEEAANVVHLRSWLDPVSRQPVPAPNSRCLGLANVTFYVRDSGSARVCIDGRDYTCLQRNPPDHTGKPSITLIDDSVPGVIFDEVDPLQRFADVVSRNAQCYYRHTGGFKGPHCLELLLEEDAGQTTWTFPNVTATDTTHVRFAYRKTNPKAVVTLRFQFQEGGELVATEGQLGQGTGWNIARHSDAEWHDVVLSLAMLTRPKPARRVPRGRLESLTIEVAGGKEGDKVFCDAIELLRNPIHPPSPDGTVLVAGRVDPPKDNVEVILEVKNKQWRTRTKQGIFLFPGVVPRGSTVKVYALPEEDRAARFSQLGRYFEVAKNEVELIIPLQDARDTARKAGTLKKLKGSVFQAVPLITPETGPIWQPRSEFASTGIGGTQEFENHLQVNNLGFLDRDHRYDNPDGARRIVLLGNCNLSPGSVPRHYHAGTLLEGFLTWELGYPVEAITLANHNVNFGKYGPYLRHFSRKLNPDVVCIYLQCGPEILESLPDLLAEYWEYDPKHLPCHLFRSNDKGGLDEVEPDPEYFRYVGKDPVLNKRREQERKKGSYFMNDIDWYRVYYLEGPLPEQASRAFEHFKRVLKYYRDEVAKGGTRLVLVLSSEYQVVTLGGNGKEFKYYDGQPCNSSAFPKRLQEACKDLDVGFLNTADEIVARYPMPQMCSWRFDSHPSPYGFEWQAEALARYLLATNFARRLPGPSPLERELSDLTQK